MIKNIATGIGFVILALSFVVFLALLFGWVFNNETDLEFKDNKICSTRTESFSIELIETCYELK